MTKKSRRQKRNDFRISDLLEWRHGAAFSEDLRPIFDGEKRRHAIRRASDILSDWQLSPLQHEASVTHSLRQALCLQGYGWSRSNNEACRIVAEGLRINGASRPSWEEGQREYVAARENCARCGSALDDGQIARRERFCSVICAKAALVERSWKENFSYDTIGFNAYQIVRKSQNARRRCAYCDGEFRPLRDDGSQKYCSLRCAGRAARNPDPVCKAPGCNRTFRFEQHKVYCSKRCRIRCEQIEGIHPRLCAHCGGSFLAKKVHAIYCSEACGETASRIRKAGKRGVCYLARGDVTACECSFCHQVFEASSTRARYCSPSCKTMAKGIRNGSWVPKVISAPLLDHLLHLAKAA